MLRRRKRQRTLETWRANRTSGASAQPAANLPPSLSAGARRRAPTPQAPDWVKGVRGRLLRWQSAAALALLLGAAVFAGYLWRAPMFRIDGAEVFGNKRVAADLIYRASYLDGQWSFTVSRADAERRIEMLDDVRSAQVKVTWPARAIVEIEETVPVMLWNGAGGSMAIDDTGRAIDAPAEADGLRVVQDEAGLLNAPGDRLDDPTFLSALAYSVPFENLTYRHGDGFVVLTAEGWEVRLGANPTAVERQVRVLDALTTELAPVARQVEFVDLRFPSRPYYRLRGGANGS